MVTNTVKGILFTENLYNLFNANSVLIGATVIGLLIVAMLLIVMHFKNRVNELNKILMINELKIQEFEINIRREERERIAQNLHDDLAGTLAAIKNNLDVIILDSKITDEKKQLIIVNELVEKVYSNVRSTSHSLFNSVQLSEEELFSQHILQLTNMTFPANKYILHVDIDDNALESISAPKRYELITVIKEAFSNIIKHSKASQIDLLVYREQSNLCISLKDNGKGFKEKYKSTSLGIKSMKKRIEKMNGFLNINNNRSGVELEISIPK